MSSRPDGQRVELAQVRRLFHQRGAFEVGVDIEALDNFLIKIGVGMVNERLMPKDDALDEIKRYSGAVQAAYAKDFKRFEKHGS